MMMRQFTRRVKREIGTRGFRATRARAVQTVGSWTWHEDFSNIVKGVMLWGPSLTFKKLMHMKEIRIGDLVGVDHIGNHYYENREYQYNRHRWVEHANLPWYSDIEPSNIPPEWYGWLHHMTDLPGNNLMMHEGGELTEGSQAQYDHNLGGVTNGFQENRTQIKQRGWEDGKSQEDKYWKQVGHPRADEGAKPYKPKVETWRPDSGVSDSSSGGNIHNRVGGDRSLKKN
eukprot:g4936.t1